MKFKILRQKSLKELNNLLFKKRTELVELRFKISESNFKKVHKIKKAKKETARILTAMSLLNNSKKYDQ